MKCQLQRYQYPFLDDQLAIIEFEYNFAINVWNKGNKSKSG